MRDHVLATARTLTIATGVVPSLNAVVAAAGVSKGGLMHHFPTRTDLIVGLARMSLDEIDAAMTDAAARGDAAPTWLRLSRPDASERALLQALAVSFRSSDPKSAVLLDEARSALARWERMIEEEVGDAMRARVIRLVGDGLVANAIAGVEPEPVDLAALYASLIGPAAAPGRHG